jgi:rubredoxin
MAMKMKRRVERLERAMPPPPPDETLQQKRWQKVLARFLRLLKQAATLLSPDEEQRVAQALVDTGDSDGRRSPYAGWLWGLQHGRCRLPNLQPTVMKELLLAWLLPEADGGMVCNRCGLEYPRHKTPPLSAWRLLPGKKWGEGPPPWYDLPELFQACPNCGASRYDMDWPHLVEGHDHAWKELDGYVGKPPDGGAA